MAKAPKLPTYKEAVELSKKPKKEKKTKLLTKEEWDEIREIEKEKERNRKKITDKKRERNITIAFRVSVDERDRIYKRIALSGKMVREFMRDSVLNAPIKVVATRKVIRECKNELEIIGEEFKRLSENNSIPDEILYNLDLVLEMISQAEIDEKKKASSK